MLCVLDAHPSVALFVFTCGMHWDEQLLPVFQMAKLTTFLPFTSLSKAASSLLPHITHSDATELDVCCSGLSTLFLERPISPSRNSFIQCSRNQTYSPQILAGASPDRAIEPLQGLVQGQHVCCVLPTKVWTGLRGQPWECDFLCFSFF